MQHKTAPVAVGTRTTLESVRRRIAAACNASMGATDGASPSPPACSSSYPSNDLGRPGPAASQAIFIARRNGGTERTTSARGGRDAWGADAPTSQHPHPHPVWPIRALPTLPEQLEAVCIGDGASLSPRSPPGARARALPPHTPDLLSPLLSRLLSRTSCDASVLDRADHRARGGPSHGVGRDDLEAEEEQEKDEHDSDEDDGITPIDRLRRHGPRSPSHAYDDDDDDDDDDDMVARWLTPPDRCPSPRPLCFAITL